MLPFRIFISSPFYNNFVLPAPMSIIMCLNLGVWREDNIDAQDTIPL